MFVLLGIFVSTAGCLDDSGSSGSSKAPMPDMPIRFSFDHYTKIESSDSLVGLWVGIVDYFDDDAIGETSRYSVGYVRKLLFNFYETEGGEVFITQCGASSLAVTSSEIQQRYEITQINNGEIIVNDLEHGYKWKALKIAPEPQTLGTAMVLSSHAAGSANKTLPLHAACELYEARVYDEGVTTFYSRMEFNAAESVSDTERALSSTFVTYESDTQQAGEYHSNESNFALVDNGLNQNYYRIQNLDTWGDDINQRTSEQSYTSLIAEFSGVSQGGGHSAYVMARVDR